MHHAQIAAGLMLTGLLLGGLAQANAAEPTPEPRTFRPGELGARLAEAAEPCRASGGDAVLLGIERVSSPEGSIYRARFACGAPPQAGFPVTYEARDFSHIRTEVETYCQGKGSRGARFTSEPAASTTVLRGTFVCE